MNRLSRIIALLLILLLMISVLSSCDWIDRLKLHLAPATEAAHGIPENNDREYVSLGSGEYTYSPYYTPVHPRHSYALLSEGQQALYDALAEKVRDVYPETDDDTNEKLYKTKQAVVEGYVLSTADIRIASKALYDDNPDLFWLSGTLYQLADRQQNYTAVQMRSIYSPEEIKSMQSEINTAVNTFYESVPADLSAYEREKYVHDYIARICEYDKEAAQSHDTEQKIPEAYIIYGALVKGKAVCEGYARTMQQLLCGLGVDCVGVTGIGYDSDGSNDLHMWNAVSLDDGWYFVDPTWDDQLYDYRRYQYFNLDDTAMRKDHTNSKLLSELSDDEISGDATFSSVAMNIYLPECNATHYSYYSFECAHLTDYDDADDVKDSLYRAALDQKEYVTVYIDPDELDYDEAVDALFVDSPQYFFAYAEEVNSWLSGYEIDTGNMSYYLNEDRSAVTVMLNYY